MISNDGCVIATEVVVVINARDYIVLVTKVHISGDLYWLWFNMVHNDQQGYQ